MGVLKKAIKKYFSSFVYFYRYLGYRIFFVLVMSILIGFLDGLGLTMFLPLLQMADGSSSATGESLGNMGFIIDWFNSIGIELNIKTALFIIFVFFSLKGTAVYISSSYKVGVNQYFISTLRMKLTALFTRFSFKAFVTSDVGRIQNSFTGEIGKVTNAYRTYMECMQQIILVLVYMLFVFTVDWKFALLICIGGIITNLLYSSIYKNTKKQSVELTKNSSSYQGLIIQYITNFKYLKATGFLNRYADKLRDIIKQIEKNNKKIGLLNVRITATREPMLIGIVCLVITIQVVVLGGQLASVLVSLLFFYRALTALMVFQSNYNNFLGASGALQNITSFEKELVQLAEPDGKNKINQLNGSIELRNVDFDYENSDEILKQINLKINKNQSVAFVGESGSGKTTLVNLISGLLKPNKGEITIDGVNLNEIKKTSYQSRIGYIAQEPVIFNDTIFNNITFWAEATEENKAKFSEAIKRASIQEFIDGLKKKENTRLGNNGINLSGGQKQRISIARELYKDIDILILDEATSALDSETEKEIQNNIDALKGNYTILIIAHRLSTVKNVDMVYLMDNGRIIGQGSFKQLIESSERFRRMVELQEI